MNSSERLRQDQEELNRRRDYRTYDRRRFIESLRAQDRIDALTARIEAHRKQKIDEALEEMWAQWPKTRAVIDSCTAVTPEVRKKWAERLEAIKVAGTRSAAERLDELKDEVERIAEGLSRFAADLRKAAGRRRLSDLSQISPLTVGGRLRQAAVPTRYPPADLADSAPLLPRRMPRWFDQLLTSLFAQDLEPIGNQLLLLADHLPAAVRFAWVDQLHQIDQPGPGTWASSAEKAETLAGEIDAVAADIRPVGSALGYQAGKCRSYWAI